MTIDVILDYINENRDSINPQVLLTLVSQYAESSGEITDATAVAADLVKGKIAYNNSGKIVGTLEVLDTSDATAVASDILATKTAYVNGEKVTGTMASVEGKTITPSTAEQTVEGQKYLTSNVIVSGDANLVSTNIKNGVTIFGVSGNANVVDTTEASNAATAEDITAGKIAFVNGQKITGTKPVA